MKAIFIPKAGLNIVADALGSNLENTNWLFVTLDSARGNLSRVREFLTPKLQRERVVFWWRAEGLWIAGVELAKTFINNEVVVPFSAAFIFSSEVKCCEKAQFDDTPDQGEFTGLQLEAATREIIRLGAKAYIADGAGLQCVVLDQDICRMISFAKTY
jgi:hypothetical protein